MNSEKILTSELLQQADIIDEAQMQQLQQHGSPWWLQILQGIAAWIASLFIISAFIGPILAVSDGSTIKAGVAVILLAGSIWLATRRQEFVQHLSVSVALAGQGLLVYTLYELFNHVDAAA